MIKLKMLISIDLDNYRDKCHIIICAKFKRLIFFTGREWQTLQTPVDQLCVIPPHWASRMRNQLLLCCNCWKWYWDNYWCCFIATLTLMRRDWWISAASWPFHHCSSLSIFPIQRRVQESTCYLLRHTSPKQDTDQTLPLSDYEKCEDC